MNKTKDSLLKYINLSFSFFSVCVHYVHNIFMFVCCTLFFIVCIHVRVSKSLYDHHHHHHCHHDHNQYINITLIVVPKFNDIDSFIRLLFRFFLLSNCILFLFFSFFCKIKSLYFCKKKLNIQFSFFFFF